MILCSYFINCESASLSNNVSRDNPEYVKIEMYSKYYYKSKKDCQANLV